MTVFDHNAIFISPTATLSHFCVSVGLFLVAVQGLEMWIWLCCSDYTDSISALNMNQIPITARQNNS